jgi:DNA-binding transcriptional regulator YdaS (Cro superfamily)
MDQLKVWIDEERGRLTKLAEACEITHSAICQWTRVPIERVAVVERVTGIPRSVLRPDVYEAA